MNRIISFLLLLFLLFCSGCASTYGLTEQQQIQAVEKYPRCALNIAPSDSDFMKTVKITGRVFICPLTLGMSEYLLLEDREASFRKYADYLYYESFIGKKCATVIQALGAPSRVVTDGQGGCIYVWESIYTTGGNTYYSGKRAHTTPLRIHKKIKEFYFSSEDKCYRWRIATE